MTDPTRQEAPTKAQEVAQEIADTKPGETARELVERIAHVFGMTGPELFEEMKKRRKERKS